MRRADKLLADKPASCTCHYTYRRDGRPGDSGSWVRAAAHPGCPWHTIGTALPLCEPAPVRRRVTAGSYGYSPAWGTARQAS